jgi:hypothetical protein
METIGCLGITYTTLPQARETFLKRSGGALLDIAIGRYNAGKACIQSFSMAMNRRIFRLILPEVGRWCSLNIRNVSDMGWRENLYKSAKYYSTAYGELMLTDAMASGSIGT